jgi:predicted NUDIX family NTP pyrophosphohydrolase
LLFVLNDKAMNKQSAGLLLYRKGVKEIEVFLVHPGGPFYKNKDEGSWSIPKGEFLADEEPFTAAKREFEEETGLAINGNFIELKPVFIKSGKKIYAWAVEGDIDHLTIKSNLFEMEWPPKSGRNQSFPEIDKGDWFEIARAKLKINAAQFGFIEELVKIVLQ